MIAEVPFLVDRRKHRIVKREGAWRLYCPKRGAEDVVYTTWPFPVIAHVLNEPCPHYGTVPPRFSTTIVTRGELTGHIDDPICTCFRCKPEWHTGVRCNCPHCIGLRDGEA